MMGAFSRFWFRPVPARRLGILRAVIGAYAIWYIGTRSDLISEIARGTSSLFRPVGIIRLFSQPLDPVMIDWLVWFTVLAGLLFVFGVAHRVVGPLFAILFLFVMCYRNSWSMIFHSHNALAVHLLILGFAPAADGFSLRARLGETRGGLSEPVAAEFYGATINLICAVTVFGYFLAGFAKLAGPHGLGWAQGETLRLQIAVDTIRKEILEGGGMPLSYMLYQQIWLFTLMGVGTYILELAAPFVLFHSKLGRLWAIGTWGLHWGILLIMGIKFRYQLSCIIFLAFFVVEKV